MLKISCPSIIKPLLIILRNCSKFRTFPDDSKNSNVVPVHKKNNKQIVNNYRPVFLLPIYSKVFKKFVFEFKIESNLQIFILIPHSIFSAFDADVSP